MEKDSITIRRSVVLCLPGPIGKKCIQPTFRYVPSFSPVGCRLGTLIMNSVFFKIGLRCMIAIMLVLTAQPCKATDEMRGHESKRLSKTAAVINSSKAIKDVDAIYDSLFVTPQPSVSLDNAQEAIGKYCNSLQESVRRQVQEGYYDAFFTANELRQREECVKTAFKYIMTGGKKDEQLMWKFLVESYGSNGDTNSTVFLLERFKNLSASQQNAYDEVITTLTTKYDDVIHPISFDDAVTGYWVSLKTRTTKQQPMLRPDYLVKINDLHRDSGCEMLISPTLPWKTKKKNNYWYHDLESKKPMLQLSQSLFCDPNDRLIRLVFASENMKEGNIGLSQNMLESNREFRANMQGDINSSDGNFGERLAATVITSATASLFDAFAMSLAVSTKKAEAYEIQLNCPSPSVMNASITYVLRELKSTGSNRLKEHIPNQRYTFVKWEPSDSIIFIDENTKPIFIGSLHKESALLKEYKEVKKKYNFWKPKYCIPIIIGAGAGGYCMYKGITMFIDDAKVNKDKMGKKGKQGLVWFIGGGGILGGVLGYFIDKIGWDRKRAYNEINRRSMQKLQRKAATLSMQPSYNPMYNAVGMNLSLSF